MKLSLGFSPCPNDTFIFDALVNRKIDTGGIVFETVLEDVETLNLWALEGKLDITKLSFPAFFQSLENYILLRSGCALGQGVGPLLISKKENKSEINPSTHTIAIPGIHTTANLLLEFAFPQAKNKTPILFSEIEDSVLSGKTDLGVIIHENRFTYQQRGLHKVCDLGEVWESKTGQPIPLGGIAAKRELGSTVLKKVNALIRQSLEYAFDKYPLIPHYVRANAQAMDESVMRQHIDLYVNNYSLDIGEGGKSAISILHEVHRRERSDNNVIPEDLILPS